MTEGAIIRLGTVTSVHDPHGGGRIQARTPYDNTEENNENLPYYFPLLPKMLHVIPKVGETVLLISMAPGEYNNMGFYVGPVISQPDKLFYEAADYSIPEIGYKGWGPNPETKDGVRPTLYPATEDITIEGRRDTGIQLKNEELRLKAGVKVVGDKGPESNVTDPAYMSLKYYPEKAKGDGFKSTATIVADKINLIGAPGESKDPATREIPVTGNKDPNAKPEDKDNLISDDAMEELVEKAHQLPYGDKLVEFLKLLRTALAKHVHPFPTMAPCNDVNMVAAQTYDLDGILSDVVRIN